MAHEDPPIRISGPNSADPTISYGREEEELAAKAREAAQYSDQPPDEQTHIPDGSLGSLPPMSAQEVNEQLLKLEAGPNYAPDSEAITARSTSPTEPNPDPTLTGDDSQTEPDLDPPQHD